MEKTIEKTNEKLGKITTHNSLINLINENKDKVSDINIPTSE